MKILVTGSEGFIARNLIVHLRQNKKIQLYLFSKKDSINILWSYLKEVDFIYHLAGVNRPQNHEEFYTGNRDFTKQIVRFLQKEKRNPTILFSSSIQVNLNNDYGRSKLEAEKILMEYSIQCLAKVYIFRLPNVFGKWSNPNYNSVIATWCNNIANGLSIKIDNVETEISLVYIDDVVESFLNLLQNENSKIFHDIDRIHKKNLKQIKNLLHQFKENRETLLMPEVGSGFERALYATYLSYLPKGNFSYPLQGHNDERGTFYEIIKTINNGQFSISTTAPGIKRGDHFHHTKNEKFLVVKGSALIEFKHILEDEIIRYQVSDRKMEIVETIPGYAHNIKNIGDEDMILLVWANENYDHDNSDTYLLEI